MMSLQMDTHSTDVNPSPSTEPLIDAPSGFILKLFQMITEADDELVKWTCKGDAFIIGSNIKRLESETLPAYFRHNRFQSLVRQLNFYSFRKVNKERNIWIYKHELFHRDHPENLFKVRRRTCPGLDGRKQRFNRFSTKRLNGENSDESSEESSVVGENDQGFDRKRGAEGDIPVSFMSKRTRRLSNESATTRGLEIVPVDTSFVTEKYVTDESEGAGDLFQLSSSLLTVSEVSDRLEEYARKARGRNRGGGRRSGIVTPPYDTSSAGLVMYDDEYAFDNDDHLLEARKLSPRLSVATNLDETSYIYEGSQVVEVTPPKIKVPRTPPVKESSLAASMVEQILERIPNEKRHVFEVSSSVARFCMSTSPFEDGDLCCKILQLIVSCELLSTEFEMYRSALQPSSHAMSIQRIWKHESSRGDAIRDFKTFAVNCIKDLLDESLASDEKIALELTADVWSKSVGVSA